MRRLPEDDRGLFDSLCSLPPGRRLFVQRWLELFDRDATHTERARPVSAESVDSELRQHEQEDFHLPLMREERAAMQPIRFGRIGVEDVDSDAVSACDRLAAGLLAVGFHPSFLYHAFKSFLSPRDTPFEDRYEGLMRWWSQNATPRQMTVVLRPTAHGVPPATGDKHWSLNKWSDLPQAMRDSVRRDTDWWRTHGQYANDEKYFLCLGVAAPDADYAASLAQEAFRYHAYRFRVPSPLETTVLVDLNELEEKDQELARLRHAYAKALEDVRRGNPYEALADLAQGIDLAMHGYIPSAQENSWKRPRLLVEKAAVLVAIDWPWRHFRYFLDYVLSPSYTVAGTRLFDDERRPGALLAKVLDDASWGSTIARAPWDELLEYRRNLIVKVCAAGGDVIKRQWRLALWDLARAVRARNALLHGGRPVRDAYLIAVLLHAFDILIRLRVFARRRGLTFTEAIRLAQEDCNNLVNGTSSSKEWVAFGWRGMRALHVATRDRNA